MHWKACAFLCLTDPQAARLSENTCNSACISESVCHSTIDCISSQPLPTVYPGPECPKTPIVCFLLFIHISLCCKQGIVHSLSSSQIAAFPCLSELGLPCDVFDLLKLGAHLDNRIPDQTGIKRHCLSQRVLCARTRVEAHDEVVAVVVGCLQFLRGLWEQEGAPVRDAAHDTIPLENNLASGFGDSGVISMRTLGRPV